MLTHGWPKFQKVVVGNFQFSDPVGLGSGLSLGLAVFAEFFCAILIMLGLFTRTALVFNAITMLIAAFVVHASDPFKTKEMALLYLVISVALILTGPGNMHWIRSNKISRAKTSMIHVSFSGSPLR